MSLLLDTYVVLWWDGQDPALSADAHDVVAAAANNILISTASVWEVVIKRRLGKLVFNGSASAAICVTGFYELTILPADADHTGNLSWDHTGNLSWDHTDPFDRLLVAQVMRRGMTMMTVNRSVKTFGGVAQIWAG